MWINKTLNSILSAPSGKKCKISVPIKWEIFWNFQNWDFSLFKPIPLWVMIIQTSKFFLEVYTEGRVFQNRDYKWFLAISPLFCCIARKYKICFENFINKAFKWIQKHYNSIMKWLGKLSLNKSGGFYRRSL